MLDRTDNYASPAPRPWPCTVADCSRFWLLASPDGGHERISIDYSLVRWRLLWRRLRVVATVVRPKMDMEPRLIKKELSTYDAAALAARLDYLASDKPSDQEYVRLLRRIIDQLSE